MSSRHAAHFEPEDGSGADATQGADSASGADSANAGGEGEEGSVLMLTVVPVAA